MRLKVKHILYPPHAVRDTHVPNAGVVAAGEHHAKLLHDGHTANGACVPSDDWQLPVLPRLTLGHPLVLPTRRVVHKTHLRDTVRGRWYNNMLNKTKLFLIEFFLSMSFFSKENTIWKLIQSRLFLETIFGKQANCLHMKGVFWYSPTNNRLVAIQATFNVIFCH